MRFLFTAAAVVLTSLLMLSSAQAHDAHFSPKSSLTCVQAATGQQVRLTFRTVVTRAGGYIFHRQMAIMNGVSFNSFMTTIPSKDDILPIGDMEVAGTVSFAYYAARDWKKDGYDYDTGENSAKIVFVNWDGSENAALKLDHCR